jgi:hypothetical protein
VQSFDRNFLHLLVNRVISIPGPPVVAGPDEEVGFEIL